MASNGVALLLLLALFISGIAILVDAPRWMGFDIGIGFNSIISVQSAIWIILAKIVGLVLTIISAFAIINIIKG